MKLIWLSFIPAVILGSLSAQTKVVVETNLGGIPITLYDEQAPLTVANFLGYVNRGDYNDVIFHRLVDGFVLQTGGFRETLVTQESLVEPIKTQFPIDNESWVSNTRGTIAMAKLSGDPDSATSQWFVNLADNSANLDTQNGGFTVFGEVTDFTTVDLISSQPVVNAGGSDFTTLPLMNDVHPFGRTDFIKITGVTSIPEASTIGLSAMLGFLVLIRRRSVESS